MVEPDGDGGRSVDRHRRGRGHPGRAAGPRLHPVLAVRPPRVAPGSASTSCAGWSRRTAATSRCGRGAERRCAVPIRAARRDPRLRRLTPSSGRTPGAAGRPAARPRRPPPDPRLGRPPPATEHDRCPHRTSPTTPSQVTPLNADEVEQARDAALAAIAAAGRPRRAQGRPPRARRRPVRRWPWPTARSGRCRRPPRPRPASGSALARRAVTEALADRQAELEAERDERVLVEEAVDVTLPWDRVAPRRPAPADHPARSASPTCSSRWATRWSEGPEVEAEWFNFDALNMPPDHPARVDAGHLLRRIRRTPASCCAPTPRRCRSAPCCAATRRSTWSRPAGSTAPTSSTRPTRRCSTRSRAWSSTRASRWPTCGAPWTTSRRRCSATA